jgi:hypothetical protein
VGREDAERHQPPPARRLTRHRIHTGKQTLRIIVPQEPARAGVDPYRKLIERERGDNVVDVETGS